MRLYEYEGRRLTHKEITGIKLNNIYNVIIVWHGIEGMNWSKRGNSFYFRYNGCKYRISNHGRPDTPKNNIIVWPNSNVKEILIKILTN